MSAMARASSGTPWWARFMSGLAFLLAAWLLWHVVEWAVLRAVVRADAQACQALAHKGACWGVVPEKLRPIALGHYPFEQQWRPVAVLCSYALLCLLAWRSGWKAVASWRGLLAVVCTVMAGAVLMHGGIFGLTLVAFDAWGGLPLTLWLFAVSWLASVPLAIGLALARRSAHRCLKWPATTVIEVVRGVPLVTLLFVAAFLLPLLIPQAHPWPLVWRATLALTLFSAVYMAEVIRGGLQTVTQDQSEAAAILGLTWWQTQWMVVLPQALRAVLPALVGHGIGLLKDSSLVMVIGLHELTGGLSLSLGGDPLWRPYYFEAYLFVGLVYALMCLGLSRMGRSLERSWIKASH
jgi:general L-amino acid transport system permease protein